MPRHEQPQGLVADVGGTHVRVALARSGRLERPQAWRCADFDSLEGALKRYLEEESPSSRPVRAAVAVACPTNGDWVELTNQSWSFSTEALRDALGLESLEVLNDLAALALSIPGLGPEDTRLIKPGDPDPLAPVAVLAPGTGLGASALITVDDRWIALSTEGGHRDLAPVTDREWQVFKVLQERFGHVSTERALSGPGLVNLYDAICRLEGVASGETGAGRIVELAREDPSGPAGEAARLFSGWLGAVAGDLVLCLGARRGVYLGGGVLPKMDGVFDVARFNSRLIEKGRFREYVETVPVHVVVRAEAALLGAATRLVMP